MDRAEIVRLTQILTDTVKSEMIIDEEEEITLFDSFLETLDDLFGHG